MNKISVILNSYNRPQYLEQAIQSVVLQTYEDWELLIVDDGSPTVDQLAQIVARYQAMCPGKIQWLPQPHCGNLATRRNDGLLAATGEYIALFDDDNLMHPERLAACVAHFQKCQQCDAVYHLSRQLSPDGQLGDPLYFFRTGEVDRESLMTTRNHIDSNEVLIRRRIFDRIGWFDENCVVLEDYDLWRRILSNGEMHFLHGFWSHYRLHEGRRVMATLPLNDKVLPYILSKRLTPWTAGLVCPPFQSLTFSQRDVIQHLLGALQRIGRYDQDQPVVRWAVAPFRLAGNRLRHRETELGATLHMEDPYAVETNLRYAATNTADWVWTNDEGLVDRYRAPNRHVGVLPSLSAFGFRDPHGPKRYEVLCVGTPFPERLQFMQQLVAHVPSTVTVTCVGPPTGQWHWGLVSGIQASDEQLDPDQLLEAYATAQIVLVLNRKTGYQPVTPARGFIEAASGSLVLMDADRPAISRYFTIGREMDWFTSPLDCAKKIEHYLAHADQREAIADAGWTAAHQYTYDVRLTHAVFAMQASREVIL